MAIVPVFSATTSSTTSGIFAFMPDGTVRALTPEADHEFSHLLPQPIVAMDGRLIFSGWTPAHGGELYWVDGQSGTFNLLADINFGMANSTVQNLVAAGDTLFFVADNPTAGRELHVLNGTTVTVARDLMPGSIGGLPGGDNRIVSLGDKVVFRAIDSITTGSEPFVSDGTAAGTFRLLDILPGASGSNPVFFTSGVLGNHAYFAASISTNGMSLYRTDGTIAGTVEVRRFNAGTDDPPVMIRDVAVSGGKVFFVADDGLNGRELWVHDPAAGTTQITRDIGGAAASSSPSSVTPFGSGVLFVASTPTKGREVWFSDGTEAGTVLVADIFTGPGHASPRSFTVVGDRAFLVAESSTHGQELWVTDGTTTGTALVRDIRPGGAGSSPEALLAAGDRLYFSADTPDAGREVWTSDGTAAGTMRVADLWPGIDFSWPRAMGLLDINFYAPGQIALSAASVAENRAAGAVVGRLSASDQDSSALSYSLVSNPGNLFRIVGNELRTNAALDFEAARSHAVTVRVSDGELSSTRAFTITVLNDAADDRSVIVGTAGPDRLVGGALADLIRGLGGNDTLLGRGGNDTLQGAAGADQLRGAAGSDVLRGGAGADRMAGGAGFDRLFGGGANDRLAGGADDDLLNGGAGRDTLSGGAGSDRLLGGGGGDRLDGGRGNDALTGGRGADAFVFKPGYGADRITDFNRAQGDRLELSDRLWTGDLSVAQVIDQFGTTHLGLQALRFGNAVIYFDGIADISDLAGSIDIL